MNAVTFVDIMQAGDLQTLLSSQKYATADSRLIDLINDANPEEHFEVTKRVSNTLPIKILDVKPVDEDYFNEL